MRAVNVLVAIFAALSLVACGGQNTPEATAPTSQPAPALTETYTSESGRITFQHPSGWVVREMGADLILAASSDATANKTFSTAAFDAGEMAVQLSLSTRTNADEPATTHLTRFATGIGIPLGEASAQTFGEHTGARVDGEGNGRHLMAAAILFEDAVDVLTGSGDTYILAVTYANPGEFTQREATLRAILDSITFGTTTED